MFWKKLLFLFVLLSFSPLFANDSTWVRYYRGLGIYSTSIVFENDSIAWIGGSRFGLIKHNLNTSEMQFINLYEEIENPDIIDLSPCKIIIDSDNVKWLMLSYYGLVSYNDTTFTCYNDEDSGFYIFDNQPGDENHIFADVFDLAIDKKGNKWLATDKGLGVYNGETWTVYNNTNSPLQSPSNKVSSVVVDENNLKWVGLGFPWEDDFCNNSTQNVKRFFSFNDTTWTTYNWEDRVVYLSLDKQKNEFWFTDCFGKIFKFNGEEFKKIDLGNIHVGNIKSIYIDENGLKWFGTENVGLICYDNEKITIYNDNIGLESSLVNHFVIDPNGTWWIGNGLSYGIMKYDGENSVYFPLIGGNGKLPSNKICDVAFDNNNAKWILTKKGLTRFNDYDWENIVANDTVLIYGDKIYFDSNNNLWINCHNFGIPPGYGLYKYDGEEWINYNTENSNIPTNNTNQMIMENREILWIASYDFGIIKYNILTNEWTIYNTENSPLPSNEIFSIAIDSHNNKWIGTKNEGLVCFNDVEWTVYNIENSNIPSNYISSVVIDNNDRKWFTSHPEEYRDLQDIVVFDDENFTIYNEENSPLARTWNYVLAVDLTGKAWIKSNAHFFSFDGNDWVEYTDSLETPSLNPISGCEVDKYNNKWFRTERGGLFVYNEGGVVGIEEEDQNQNLPKTARLFQNYPNPFNPSTTISYNLVKPSNAQIKVFNILGQQIWESSAKMQKAGTHSLVFDASRFGSNIYFYRLEVNREVADTKKMILIK